MATIILLRHGRTSANAAGILAGWSRDVHLDDVGREQAARAADTLARATVPDAIVSSPLVRCRETAEALSAATGVPVSLDAAVGECRYGAWTGRSLAELANEELWSLVQRAPSQVTFPPSDAYEHESMTVMQERTVAAVRALATRLDQGADRADAGARSGEPVGVVVSHGDVIKAVLSQALGQRLDDFQRIVISPASMSVVQYTGDQSYVLASNVAADGLSHVLGGSHTVAGGAAVGGSTGADGDPSPAPRA